MFYTYYCPQCGKEEEFMHGMLEEPEYRCSEDNTVLKKKITGGCGVHYKGNGWPRKNSGLMENPKKRYVHDLVVAQKTGE